MATTDTFPSVGDWVQVQIKWQRSTKNGLSVVSGTIVEEDDRIQGFQQFKLDTGTWFSPQSDLILRHEPGGLDDRQLHVDGPRP